MLKIGKAQIAKVLLTGGLLGYACGAVAAAEQIEGHVDLAGSPVAQSTVALWVAGTNEPKQLAQTKTSRDGRFQLQAGKAADKDAVLYLVAKGAGAKCVEIR